MTSSTCAAPFLYQNGVVSHSTNTPLITTFLDSNPGAYTTTRTHNNASSLLFWPQHLQRLSNSTTILVNSNPQFFFKNIIPTKQNPLSSLPQGVLDSKIKALVNDSMKKVLPLALKERNDGEELAITALVSGDSEKLKKVESLNRESDVIDVIDVCLHIGKHVPLMFGVKGNHANLAVVGRGRDFAEAKYSDWVRLRKPLEKLRPPLVTELLLSDDGDHILEGCVTNFFVVCCKDSNEVKGDYFHNNNSKCPFKVQTAPIHAGILPGIMRQLVIDVCLSKGIPVEEVAPSWSMQESWQEAFITNSLRIMQHVEKIQVPSPWESMEQKTLEQVSWQEKHFQDGPGMITTIIQKEIMEKACVEGWPF
ncbi:uncharacterized protein LOC8263379 [Ricinus communis]|uniref:Uncharacterized protein n=1 Tax=Ricinus communis TaxID=3988 RepID=B9SD44_RICCO|nr:uncharacterized protein LOC8263379 [Ricinus communis]EEF38482.1 conserved hypothetical protein [Ricinus communis]|eukprot:XP_002523913.1 uncharacterized protein LOC8263379 [Ricinus communis]